MSPIVMSEKKAAGARMMRSRRLRKVLGSWLRLYLVMDGDIIRVEIELRRAAVAAVVVLANLCSARATTLGTFQSFDMRGHPND